MVLGMISSHSSACQRFLRCCSSGLLTVIIVLHVVLYCSLLLVRCLQLTQQLSAVEAAARTQLKQAEAQHQAQLEELAAGHAARVEVLRGELAADATTAKKAETKMQVRCLVSGRAGF
jgi:sensor domain CHASE-containing protein